MAQREFACAKCGLTKYETEEIRTTGSGLSRFLNLQNKKFGPITCSNCGYTEMYRLKSGGRVADVIDIFTN